EFMFMHSLRSRSTCFWNSNFAREGKTLNISFLFGIGKGVSISRANCRLALRKTPAAYGCAGDRGKPHRHSRFWQVNGNDRGPDPHLTGQPQGYRLEA